MFVRTLAILLVVANLPAAGFAQGLREVPQRFAYVQPIGLILGMGTAGLEFSVGRRTSLEVGGIGVYSKEDGILFVGGGPGVGIRQYFGTGERAGMVLGGRVDGVWLRADNSDAVQRFLTTGALRGRRDHLYLGLGATLGFRWVWTSGWFAEPSVSYEYFVGPRTLVPGSRGMLDDLGATAGIAFGFAW